jgi:hypothetical protein
MKLTRSLWSSKRYTFSTALICKEKGFNNEFSHVRICRGVISAWML